MSVKLLTDHHLALLNLKGGWTGSSESALVKIPHCWKSHVAAQFSHVSLIKNTYVIKGGVCLFVCFVALRPKSTATVIAGRSVHLTTLFHWQT